MPVKINDGLTRTERYRLKDIDGYRKRKREYARTPEEKRKRVEYMRIWREKNRVRHNETARQSYKRNKHKHAHKTRERHLINTYGITEKTFQEMLKAQNNSCKICGRLNEDCSRAGARLHIDHDHHTKKVRGLLCMRCNTALGWYENNSIKILKYLKRT